MRTTYFMIRVQQAAAQERGPLIGMVERLGSGEKHRFAGDQELLRLLRSWPVGSAGAVAGDSGKPSGAAPGSDNG